MYVDDGAIYATSATIPAAAKKAADGLEEVTKWLKRNGLDIDSSKSKLLTFKKRTSPTRLLGDHVNQITYKDPNENTHVISQKVPWVRYLGVFIDRELSWELHVKKMAARARSTINGISLLGNSVRGLDFLNWRKVYNALVVPILTYGVPAWFTGRNQKGLTQFLTVAQNQGLRKMTGVFKTTPCDPLHNLARVPPIPYLLNKLTASYTQKLQALNPEARILTVTGGRDRCRIWPDYVQIRTNLTALTEARGASTYIEIPNPLRGNWAPPRLTYNPHPTPHSTEMHKQAMLRHEASDAHIFIHPHTHKTVNVAIYFIQILNRTIHQGAQKGVDQTQALCRAVKAACSILPTQTPHIFIWARPSLIFEKILTNKPHRETHTVHAIWGLLTNFLDSNKLWTVSFRSYLRTWRGAPKTRDIRTLEADLNALVANHPEDHMTPTQTMWKRYSDDYAPSDKPSHVACTPPSSNKPPPAIAAAINTHSRGLTSSIFRLAVGYNFDASYSIAFRPTAGDNLICPCSDAHQSTGSQPHIQHLHTKEHVIFKCTRYAQQRQNILSGITSLRSAFQTLNNATRLCEFLSQTRCSILFPLPPSVPQEPRGERVPRPDPP